MEDAESRRHRRDPINEPATLEWIDGNDATRMESATIHDQSEQGVGMTFSEPLPAGTPVLVHREGSLPLTAVVRHCEQREAGFVLGLRTVDHERRRFDRHPVNEPAVIEWLPHSGDPERHDVVIRDASATGVQLDSPVAVERDATIRVIFEGWMRYGTAVHCQPRGGGRFGIGVHFSGPLQGADFDGPEDQRS